MNENDDAGKEGRRNRELVAACASLLRLSRSLCLSPAHRSSIHHPMRSTHPSIRSRRGKPAAFCYKLDKVVQWLIISPSLAPCTQSAVDRKEVSFEQQTSSFRFWGSCIVDEHNSRIGPFWSLKIQYCACTLCLCCPSIACGSDK